MTMWARFLNFCDAKRIMRAPFAGEFVVLSEVRRARVQGASGVENRVLLRAGGNLEGSIEAGVAESQ